jgi:hypothetical protein
MVIQDKGLTEIFPVSIVISAAMSARGSQTTPTSVVKTSGRWPQKPLDDPNFTGHGGPLGAEVGVERPAWKRCMGHWEGGGAVAGLRLVHP